MSSPVLLRSSMPWGDDTKLAMTRLERHCNAILATVTYLKRVCLSRVAHLQLNSMQYLLIGQHSEMTSAVRRLCQDLYKKQSGQFEALLSSANASLASLCCWLDRRLAFARQSCNGNNFITIEENNDACKGEINNNGTSVMSDYRDKISDIIDACRCPTRIESDCRQRLRSSLPSELDCGGDFYRQSQSDNPMESFGQPADVDSADAAAAIKLSLSSSASTSSSGSSSSGILSGSLIAKDRCGKSTQDADENDNKKSGEEDRSEDSTQTEEEITEELVKVDGVLYKRRVLRRRRQKVVRTRTVVSSAQPPVLGPATNTSTAAAAAAAACASSTTKGSSSTANRLEDGAVVLRRPEAAAEQNRLVTQYMLALGDSRGVGGSGGSGGRDDLMLIDFSRHSAIESFDLSRARWRQLLSAAETDSNSDQQLNGQERTRTVCLVSEQQELEPGRLFVQRSATVSRTVRQPGGVTAASPSSASAASSTTASVAVETVLPPHCQEDLCDLLVWDTANANHATNSSSGGGDDCILVRGGPLDALLVYACLPGNDRPHILFCESFAATFPCFAKPTDLLTKIVERCLHFKTKGNKETLWKSSFAFLIRVLDESTQQDRQRRLNNNETGESSVENTSARLMNQLALLKQRLLADGNLAEVQILGSALHCLSEEVDQQTMSIPSAPAAAADSGLSLRRRSILEFGPKQVAEQITLLDAQLYRRIDIQEYLAFVRARSGEQFANLQAFINFFNRLGFWVKTLILGRPSDRMRDRQRQMSFFCKVAEELRRHHNFNSHLAIVLCLVSLDRLPWPGRSVRRKLKDFTSRLANQSAFAREYFRNMSTTEPPLVPHVGEVLKYLTRIHEGVIGNDEIRQLPANYPVERAKSIGPVINYWKYWMSFNCLDFCIKFKRYSANSMYYDFQRNEEILASIDNFSQSLDESQLADLDTEIRHKYSHRPK